MHNSPAELRTLATNLLRGIEEGDLELLSHVYAADATVWHNNDDVEQDRAQVVGGVRALHSALKIQVAVLRFSPTDTGFLQTQQWAFSLPSGESVAEFRTAFVADVNDRGEIERLEEFLDGAQVARLVAAFR